jgi:two-component system phosphate regulon sensor histidine kinase PhoR
VAIEALQNFDALESPERTQEYLAISQLELNRLSLLVDKVLRMSLFEQGEPELKTEPLDLRLLVEEVLSAMKLQFEKYRAEVGFSVSGTDFSLRGDRLHLVSVLYNLLENALKYSPLPPKITVSLAHSEHQLTLQVKDQGRGIPSEYQSRIFEKFFRVPTGDVHDVKGHGLGLNYVAGVVQLHQGSIEVESKEGRGTAFTVRLPGGI